MNGNFFPSPVSRLPSPAPVRFPATTTAPTPGLSCGYATMVARKSPDAEEGRESIARNPKATHDYHILETWEAGIVLSGTEVKALRGRKASIKEGFARVDRGEVFLEGVNITPYEQGNRYNNEPVRARKLLLHKREIERMIGAVEQQGLTLVPLELYFKNGRVKVAVSLAKGKKDYDKRETIKRRDTDRETRAAMKHLR